MFLEAIENITGFEDICKERKASAEAQARQIVQDAEKSGYNLLQQVRSEFAEEGKRMLQQAEDRAKEKAAVIRSQADNDIAAMTKTAAEKLDEAAEFIIGRVVNN